MKVHDVQAGVRTRVIRTRTSSIPRTYRLTVEPAPGSGPVGGTVEVQGSRWLFRRDPATVPLDPLVEVRRGYWDTLFTVWVTPVVDVRVTVR
ncbi:MAG: hypothetical protein KQH83_12685 [Actinobacteria bacterium]|nr:hypothetical protein [Actinomycetota bacterium]